ncbi:MFS general substrate transporter [Exidia glandulosa HHB12029]|uniref:MFS general substrate transporter n=1 Tax=Exidia glandulosa HHB12029 TaxID=1314781 RepID=A0A166AF16_EXIGL|nr:MFS general substrate transporter [Exidia glandulosa HHB12029]
MASALPRHEDGALPQLDDAADASVTHLDYPEPEPLVRQLRNDVTSTRTRLGRRWKRPSVYWVLPLAALRLLVEAMQAAPIIEIFTRMACQVHRPDLGIGHVRYPDWRDDPLPQPAPVTWFRVQTLPVIDLTFDNSTTPPTRGDECAKDPVVQQAVASIITVLGTIAGLLTTVTAAWWGQRSDIWGRTFVLAVSTVASLARDGNIVLAAYFSPQLPGKSYWWLLPGTIVIGFLGGASGNAALQAYLADCTEPGTRAAIFAINTGISWGGVALAPLIGAALIRWSGDLLSVFYVSLVANAFVLIMFIFLVPESLTSRVREENKAKRRSVFLPRRKDNARGRDWNLSVVGAVYFLVSIGTGYALFLMQLGQRLWGWDSEMTGYWLSLIGICRAVYLLGAFPLIIRVFKPKRPAVALAGPETQLQRDSVTDTDSIASSDNAAKETPVPWFDLTVTQVVLVIETIVYILVFFAATPKQWIISTMGIALGGSLSPSLMSLALAISPGGDKEVGSLFGAFSVLLSLGDDVIGQLITGALFTATVSKFPRAILIFSAVLHGLPFLLLFLIRLPARGVLRATS